MKNFSRKVKLKAVAAFASIVSSPVFASAQGGLQAEGSLNDLSNWLYVIIPLGCVIAGALGGAAYAMDIIRKETLKKWIIGMLISASASGIAGFFFS